MEHTCEQRSYAKHGHLYCCIPSHLHVVFVILEHKIPMAPQCMGSGISRRPRASRGVSVGPLRLRTRVRWQPRQPGLCLHQKVASNTERPECSKKHKDRAALSYPPSSVLAPCLSPRLSWGWGHGRKRSPWFLVLPVSPYSLVSGMLRVIRRKRA